MTSLLLWLIIILGLWLILLSWLLVYLRLILLIIILGVEIIYWVIIIKIVTLIIIKMINISWLRLNIPLICIFWELKIISLLRINNLLSWKIMIFSHVFSNRIKLSVLIILVFELRLSIISIIWISLLNILHIFLMIKIFSKIILTSLFTFLINFRIKKIIL